MLCRTNLIIINNLRVEKLPHNRTLFSVTKNMLSILSNSAKVEVWFLFIMHMTISPLVTSPYIQFVNTCHKSMFRKAIFMAKKASLLGLFSNNSTHLIWLSDYAVPVTVWLWQRHYNQCISSSSSNNNNNNNNIQFCAVVYDIFGVWVLSISPWFYGFCCSCCLPGTLEVIRISSIRLVPL